MLTIYNLANTSAWCVGSIVGGSVLAALGPSMTSYWTIFAMSSSGRLLALVLLLRIDPVPLPTRPLKLAWRIFGMRPSAGSMSTPVLATIESPLPSPASVTSSAEPGDAKAA